MKPTRVFQQNTDDRGYCNISLAVTHWFGSYFFLHYAPFLWYCEIWLWLYLFAPSLQILPPWIKLDCTSFALLNESTYFLWIRSCKSLTSSSVHWASAILSPVVMPRSKILFYSSSQYKYCVIFNKPLQIKLSSGFFCLVVPSQDPNLEMLSAVQQV